MHNHLPRTGQITVYTELDLLALEIPSLAVGCQEIITLYNRMHTTTILRQEGKDILEGATFGGDCYHILRDWLLRPMAEDDKKRGIRMYRGKDERH